MTARINLLNIGIVLLLLVSGVFVAFQDSQHEKAAIASGVNKIGEGASAAIPVSALQESVPSVMVNQVDNSLVVTSGITILVVVIFMVIAWFLFGFIACMSCCARC